MTVIMLVPGGFDPGGQERVIPALLWLTQRLAAEHAVHVCVTNSPHGPRRYQLAGATVHELGPIHPQITQITQIMGRTRARLTSRLPGWRVAQLWQQLGAISGPLARAGSLTAIHGFWAGTSGVLAGLLGRRYGVPAVLSIGGGELVWLPEVGYGGQGHWRSRVQTTLALRLATTITAGSDYALAPLAGRSNTHRVPLGVELALFHGQTARDPGPPWRLVHVASLNRIKDQETLLQTLRLILNALPDTVLDILGEDTLNGAVQRRAAALGLSNHVRFHGFVPNAALPAWYAQAHLHLLTSRFESQAVVVAETAAAGLATVGTAVGVLPELAPHAAVALPVGDAAGLARAALALLADPAQRERMAAAAQRWAQQHDAAWTAAQFARLYQEGRT